MLHCEQVKLGMKMKLTMDMGGKKGGKERKIRFLQRPLLTYELSNYSCNLFLSEVLY